MRAPPMKHSGFIATILIIGTMAVRADEPAPPKADPTKIAERVYVQAIG